MTTTSRNMRLTRMGATDLDLLEEDLKFFDLVCSIYDKSYRGGVERGLPEIDPELVEVIAIVYREKISGKVVDEERVKEIVSLI